MPILQATLEQELSHGPDGREIYWCWNCLHRHGRCRRRRRHHLRQLFGCGDPEPVCRGRTVRQLDFRLRHHRGAWHLLAADRAAFAVCPRLTKHRTRGRYPTAPQLMEAAMAQGSVEPVGSVEVPASEHGAGFPPFNAHTFASQLLWLALIFLALYLLMSRIALPRIGSILEARRQRIQDDLAEAQRFKDASDAAIAAHEKALAEARGRAQALANETRAKAAAAAEARRKEVDAKLHAHIAESEKTIAEKRSAAMGNVRNIASEAAGAIVERLTGISPASEEVAQAISQALKR